MSTFNGWGEPVFTWNIALMGNEESLTVLARRIARGGNYKDLADVLLHSFGKVQTPDGVSSRPL